MKSSYMHLQKDLSTREAAKVLKISTGTIQNLVDTGRIVGWKTMGGHRRISTSALSEYITANNLECSHTLDNSVKPRVVLLSNLFENTKSHIESLKSGINIDLKFYECAVEMQLNLLNLKPVLILIDFGILEKIGGNAWIESVKKNNNLRRIQILTTESVLQKSEIERANLLNKKTIEDIFLSKWFSGFITGYSIISS